MIGRGEVLEYWPEHIKRMKDFKAISDAYNFILDGIWEACNKTENNQYLDTLDEDGCSRQERFLGITANPSDNLDERKRRIKGYYATSLPYTEKRLIEVLQAMCGEDGFELVVNSTLRTIDIKVKLNSICLVNNVEELAKRMRPCDMVLTVSVIYNIHARFVGMAHEAMGGYTHQQLREDEVFMTDFNMYCNIGKYTQAHLSAYTHEQVMKSDLSE